MADKRVLFYEAEFARLLRICNRENATLPDMIREAFDAGNLRNAVKGSPATATNAHIGIIGHITPEELTALLSPMAMSNGFINRFLFAYAERSKLLPGGDELADVDFHPLTKAIQEGFEKSKASDGPYRVEFTPEAATSWETFYKEHDKRRYAGMVGKMTERGPVHVRRVGMVLALIDGKRCIELEHLIAAIAIWDYHVATVFHLYGRKRYDRKGMRLLNALKDSGDKGLTRTEISTGVFSRNLKEVELDEVLETVVYDGLVASRKRQADRGRPPDEFILTPYGKDELNEKNHVGILQSIINK